jgi:hypothetical protein
VSVANGPSQRHNHSNHSRKRQLGISRLLVLSHARRRFIQDNLFYLESGPVFNRGVGRIVNHQIGVYPVSESSTLKVFGNGFLDFFDGSDPFQLINHSWLSVFVQSPKEYLRIRGYSQIIGCTIQLFPIGMAFGYSSFHYGSLRESGFLFQPR